MSDERERLYKKAIEGRDKFPIRGNWAEAVRKDRKEKLKKRRLNKWQRENPHIK